MTLQSGALRELPVGLIVEIAAAAGIDVPGPGHKHPIRCPLHEDDHASAFIDADTNVFYCSACTPDGGWSARRFAEALGVAWVPGGKSSTTIPVRAPLPAVASAFTAADARRTWAAALARTRDDDTVDADRDVYDFLRSRGLLDAWELAAFGIVAAGMNLPAAITGWPRTGHQVVVPLYDCDGTLANVQARAIRKADKKTLFPAGSMARGTVFASRTGLAVLKGQWSGEKVLILGEGLTDFLALSITSSIPVLSAPGSGLATKSIGPWVADFTVLLALDSDSAGDGATNPTARRIFEHGGARVRRLEWPEGSKDACDFLERCGAARLVAAIEEVLRG